MARKKKMPSKVVDTECLSETMKEVYGKIYDSYNQENIITLRQKAKNIGVESPTTLKKEDLVKRIADRLISGYIMSNTEKDEFNPFGTLDDKNAQKIKGIFEEHGGECRVGRALVPEPIVKSSMLRSGDLVEGLVCDEGGIKMLAVVNNVEGEAPVRNRKWFSDIPVVERREFSLDTSGTVISSLMPDLRMGERVIADMTWQTAKDIVASASCGIGLFLGVEPEKESDVERGNFVVSFDCALQERRRLARLALNRAKRLAERGKDVVLVVYGFDNLGDSDTERALFGAGRCFANGSLTVIADVNKEKEYGVFAKIATRII